MKNSNKVKENSETKEVTIRGPYFMSQAQLFTKLGLGRSTYEKLTNPSSEYYDPDFPKPVNIFTGKKLRYSSIDVDRYIMAHSNLTDAA
nr:hypothetical protein [Alteromonas macleodii]